MPSRARRAAAEFVGTFFLVFFGVGAIATDTATGALGHLGVSSAFGLVVGAMVYAVGHLSGAHLNPAVTVAFCAIRRFEWAEAPAYVGAQVVGAGLAALVLDVAVGLGDGVGVTIPSVGPANAMAIEMVLTFALMFVIVAVATDDRAPAGFSGVAIGSAVLLGALVGGPLTGGSMNPARSIGPAWVTGHWTSQWLYCVAPVVGATLGAGAYELLRRSDGRPSDRVVETEVRISDTELRIPGVP